MRAWLLTIALLPLAMAQDDGFWVTIELRDGSSVKGKLLKYEDHKYRVHLGDKELEIVEKDVKRIEYSGKEEPTKAVPSDSTQRTPDRSLLDALRWLARHQNKHGSWSVRAYTANCGENSHCKPNPGDDDFEVGVTGLALLAFGSAGYTTSSKQTHDGICFGDVVKKGLDYLMRNQEDSGRIGRETPQFMYSHVLAAWALAAHCSLTETFKGSAAKAAEYTLAAQNPGKGWRYTARSGDNDSSVTGLAVLSLKAAESAAVVSQNDFKASLQDARAWFRGHRRDSRDRGLHRQTNRQGRHHRQERRL